MDGVFEMRRFRWLGPGLALAVPLLAPPAATPTAHAAPAAHAASPPAAPTQIAGGQAIYSGGHRCSLGVNVRSGTTYSFVTTGRCAGSAAVWYADSAGTTVLGTRTSSSFPGNDYAIVRYTTTVAHPSAVHTYPGTVAITGAGNAVVGMSVCRSGTATGVVLGILSSGSGNCTTGGTTYYQPITEILAAYGVSVP